MSCLCLRDFIPDVNIDYNRKTVFGIGAFRIMLTIIIILFKIRDFYVIYLFSNTCNFFVLKVESCLKVAFWCQNKKYEQNYRI